MHFDTTFRDVNDEDCRDDRAAAKLQIRAEGAGREVWFYFELPVTGRDEIFGRVSSPWNSGFKFASSLAGLKKLLAEARSPYEALQDKRFTLF